MIFRIADAISSVEFGDLSGGGGEMGESQESEFLEILEGSLIPDLSDKGEASENSAQAIQENDCFSRSVIPFCSNG